MNALPIKSHVSPHVAVDQLIADHGFGRIALAVVARIFRRSRPPDARPPQKLRHYHLTEHLRRDLGLPPDDRPGTHADLSYLQRTYFR